MLNKALNVRKNNHKIRSRYRKHKSISRVFNRVFCRFFNLYNRKSMI